MTGSDTEGPPGQSPDLPYSPAVHKYRTAFTERITRIIRSLARMSSMLLSTNIYPPAVNLPSLVIHRNVPFAAHRLAYLPVHKLHTSTIPFYSNHLQLVQSSL